MSFDDAGYELLESVIDSEEAGHLLALLSQQQLEPLRGGIRRIEQLVPEVAALAHSPKLLNIVQRYLSAPAQLVRAIYFDKSPTNNWLVSWHQDKTVAVSERFEQAGWGLWSLKADVWHVQPPLEVLEQMVTIRIHLDPAIQDNGCLKIARGSHQFGLLAADHVLDHIDHDQVIYCETPIGGAVMMRPLLLHASEKSITPTPRRLLHFEYSSFQLPDGIAWAA